MAQDYANQETIQECIRQLNLAIYNHQQWYASMIRTLICRLPSDDNDLDSQACHKCRFGQWYYNKSIPEKIANHPGFLGIGLEHERMHAYCTDMLLENNRSGTIDPMSYDKFANSLERLRLEILALSKELEESLYNHDSLTGAMTRVSMFKILRDQQEMNRRLRTESCLAMLDIDFFKSINDKHGHLVGDEVLSQLINFAAKSVRPYDKLFRYGGEEFLFAMPNTDLSSGCEVMERLRTEIMQHVFEVGPSLSIQLTVSIGLAKLDSLLPIEISLDHVDRALYEAKEHGRNCIKLWRDELN